MSSLIDYIRKHGLFSIYRIPSRLLLKVLDYFNTFFYKLSLASLGSGSIIQFGVVIENPRCVHIGRNVIIKRGTIFVSENTSSTLNIGNDVQINNNVRIDHTGNLTVGNSSLISDSVKIYSHSHGLNPRSIATPIPKSIGRNVWLGADCTILEGAESIGDNVVVGACSLVTRSLASNTLAVGVPAKVIREI